MGVTTVKRPRHVSEVKSAGQLLEDELFAQELDVTSAVEVVHRKASAQERALRELHSAQDDLLKAQKRVLGTRSALAALAKRDGAENRLADYNMQHRRIAWRMAHGMAEEEARRSSGAWATSGYERLDRIVNPEPVEAQKV